MRAVANVPPNFAFFGNFGGTFQKKNYLFKNVRTLWIKSLDEIQN